MSAVLLTSLPFAVDLLVCFSYFVFHHISNHMSVCLSNSSRDIHRFDSIDSNLIFSSFQLHHVCLSVNFIHFLPAAHQPFNDERRMKKEYSRSNIYARFCTKIEGNDSLTIKTISTQQYRPFL